MYVICDLDRALISVPPVVLALNEAVSEVGIEYRV
jgi:hypothetical protein